MLDITLLQCIKRREDYDYYRPMVRDHLIDDRTKTLLYDFKAYFDEYSGHSEINFDVFPTWWRQFRHPNIKKDELEFYEKVFKRIQESPDEESALKLRENLQDLHFATVVANKAHDTIDGKITGEQFLLAVQDELDKTMTERAKTGDVPWDTRSIVETVDSLSYEHGLKFKLRCLDKSLGSLHAGKFGIVSAYVDSGKSTFLADQYVAGMLRQIVDENNKDKWFYNRPIMWFNNEGGTGEIKMYCLQSLWGVSYDRIQKNPQKVEEAFNKITGGKDLMNIIPCQGWHIKEAERYIKMYKPAVVIYDMLDNFGGFESEGTVDQRFRDLYDYARQMAVKYDHTAVGTSQCTGEANGLERIEMHLLAGSRVAKQSTADYIITIGRSLEMGKQGFRYIYTPKNKLQAQQTNDFDRYTNQEVVFRGDIKRFIDPPTNSEEAF